MLGSLLPAPRSLLVAALVLSLVATAGFARVGEPVAKLKERFGKGPDPQSPKGKAIWFIESIDGALVYTVTLNAKGISIAEGIKPVRRALLTKEIAQDFIDDQMVLLKDSKTARQVKPGEKYQFAQQVFVCGELEYVMVDEAKDLLIIWSRGAPTTVMAVTRAVLLPAGG